GSLHIVGANAERIQAIHGISGLRTSLAGIQHLEVSGTGGIQIEDIGGGYGREGSFLRTENILTFDGAVDIATANNLSVGDAKAGGVGNNLKLASSDGLVQILGDQATQRLEAGGA